MPRKAQKTTQLAADGIVALSHKLTKLVEDLRKPFSAFAAEFAALTLSRAELAPRFMKVFHIYQEETDRTFVDFVRLIDPSVPADRVSYRTDRSYLAATYLQRLAARSAAPRRRGPKPVTPLVALARLVATVLPAIDPHGAIWGAFVHEMHWSDAQAKRVQTLAQKQGAIDLPKPQARALRLAS